MIATAPACTCKHERRQHRQGRGRCQVASCTCLFAPSPAVERASAEVGADAFNALTEGISQAQIVCCFSVPGEPAAKMRPRFDTRSGRTYTPVETVAAEARVLAYLKTLYPSLEPCADHVGLVLRFYLKGVGRSDCDNLIKLILDAGNEVIYEDDRQVRKIDAEMIDNNREPRSDILVYRLGDRLL